MKRLPYGAVVGAILGLVILVFAPMIDSIDTHVAFLQGTVITTRNYLLPDHWKLLLLAAGVVATLGVSALRQPPVAWAASITAGAMLAWVARVALDLAHDKTDHNLLPFEGLFDVIGLSIATGFGVAIGYVLRRMADRELARTTRPT